MVKKEKCQKCDIRRKLEKNVKSIIKKEECPKCDIRKKYKYLLKRLYSFRYNMSFLNESVTDLMFAFIFQPNNCKGVRDKIEVQVESQIKECQKILEELKEI